MQIPRKGGPGITQSDLLVINKTDLAAAVGADLGVLNTTTYPNPSKVIHKMSHSCCLGDGA